MATKRMAVAMACVLLAGCDMGFELDFSGVDWPDELVVGGAVYVGDYPATQGEVRIHVYAAADTLVAIQSIWGSAVAVFCGVGSYCANLGMYPATSACDYLARAERWDGVRSELKPLFVARPTPCAAGPAPFQGARFDLPAYEPLTTPFSLTGTVYVDADSADAGEASVRVSLRSPVPAASIPSDSAGRFTYTTTDAALRFHLCGMAEVFATAGTRSARTFLGGVPLRACPDTRHLPDARIGWTKVATGRVTMADSVVQAGVARVELLDPSDSSVKGESWTFDDGSYHLWIPFGTATPGCDWRLRAMLGAAQQTIQLLPAASASFCGSMLANGGVYNSFSFPGG